MYLIDKMLMFNVGFLQDIPTLVFQRLVVAYQDRVRHHFRTIRFRINMAALIQAEIECHPAPP